MKTFWRGLIGKKIAPEERPRRGIRKQLTYKRRLDSILFDEDVKTLNMKRVAKMTRSNTTAIPCKYPMYLISVQDFLKLYEPDKNILDAHQVLKEKRLLHKFRDISKDKHVNIIFVSHEWLGFEHPDPEGVYVI